MPHRPFRQLLPLMLGMLLGAAASAASTTLAVATVRSSSSSSAQTLSADGVVEALRQSVLSSQVAGAIVGLNVKPGDAVKADAVLLRIDARAAEQEARAGRAQVEAARAAQSVAAKDYARQQQLFARQYISAAQLERAEAQFKAASAQSAAQIAQAGALQTQSGFYTLRAPYAGLVADVPVVQGDMAMPGRPLVTLYDPSALRVTVTVPQQRVAELLAGQPVTLTFPGLPQGQRVLTAIKMTVLPVADAGTHTVQLRLDLAPNVAGLTPGMFARASLPLRAGTGESGRLYVPATALVRRAELVGLYVLNAQGKPVLRQVRAGAALGNEQEILSGVGVGEQVALDPIAAAQQR